MFALNRSRVGSGIAVLVALCMSACGGGGGGGGATPGGGGTGQTPPPAQPNRAPTAANDTIRADGATLATVQVLANDTDPDGDKLTLTIDEAPTVGTATANADGSVRLDGLGNFKGVTRFKYHVADPAGLTSSATAAIFVGTDPFRVLFAGDPNANGAYEVYLANFVTTPTAVTVANEGTRRLAGFAASDNGATVAYRRVDSGSSGASDLSFVQTATPTQQVRITLPTGTTLTQSGDGRDQYRVSPNGQYIVFIAKDGGNAQAAYILNVSTPTTLTKVNVAGAAYASLPRFSRDSRFLYLLAGPSANGANKSLYAYDVSAGTISQFSKDNNVASADDVIDYSIASDQSRILIRANRQGREGLFFIDPASLRTEVAVSHTLASSEQIVESTTGLPAGLGGSALGDRVAYITQNGSTYSLYVANVSATPSPHSLYTGTTVTQAVRFRPDDKAIIYARGIQVYETVAEPTVSDASVGAGSVAWYDSTGNIVLLKQFLPYPALATVTRGTFGNTQPVGTPGLAAHWIDVSGFDRGVVVIGEGPSSGATTATLKLYNAQAPDKPLQLADFQSPLNLTSDTSVIVSN